MSLIHIGYRLYSQYGVEKMMLISIINFNPEPKRYDFHEPYNPRLLLMINLTAAINKACLIIKLAAA